MRDHVAHRYFDTAHAMLRATVDEDLPEFEPGRGAADCCAGHEGVATMTR
jgi:hypothetical protein